MHAAVIELDALSDAVGSAAEHQDLGPLRGPRFALFVVTGIQVRRAGGELGRAGIDALVHRPDREALAPLAEHGLGQVEQRGKATVGKTLALESVQTIPVQGFEAARGDGGLFLDQILDLREEPGVDTGMRIDRLHG